MAYYKKHQLDRRSGLRFVHGFDCCLTWAINYPGSPPGTYREKMLELDRYLESCSNLFGRAIPQRRWKDPASKETWAYKTYSKGFDVKAHIFLKTPQQLTLLLLSV